MDNLGTSERTILLEASALVHKAALMGVILEIERTPLQPLAMGHHEATISVWTARNRDDKRRELWEAEMRERRAESERVDNMQRVPE